MTTNKYVTMAFDWTIIYHNSVQISYCAFWAGMDNKSYLFLASVKYVHVATPYETSKQPFIDLKWK